MSSSFGSILVIAAAGLVGAVQFAHASDSDRLLSGYSLTSWNDDAGRPLGPVYAIAQDSDGYLWIGTDTGLLRFDGWRFTPLERVTEVPVPAAAVRALSITRDGSLWMGFADRAGVGRMHDGRLSRHDRGLEGLDTVTDLVEDGRGVMWAIADRALYVLHADRWQQVRLPWKAREGQVQHLYVTRSGQLWVGTRWGVFAHIEATNAFRRVSDEHVWGLVEDAAGQMWTTDIVAGFRQVGAPGPPRHSQEGAGYRLMYDQHDDLWVATFGHGLWRVTRADEAFLIERAALRTGLSSDSVQSMMVDRDGNVWVGTTAGLHRLTKRPLTPLEDIGFVLAVQPWDDGRVVAGTTNGLVRLQAVNGRWRQTRIGSAMPDIRSLYRDRQGTLWIGATDGLWRLSGDQLVPVPLPLRSDMLVLSISPDQQSGLWLGDGEWLYRWDGASLEPLALPPSSADLRRLTFVRADRSGRLWLGFAGAAIGRMDVDGTFRLLGSSEGFKLRPNQTLHAVYEDTAGVVWLGSSHGLMRFAGGRVDSIGRAHGLPGDRVWAIVEDLQQRLWLSLDRGLVSVTRDEIAMALADPSYRMQYRIYDPLDGLAGAPIGIIGAARERDGHLWFVRGGGVTRVNPETLEERAAGLAPLKIEEAVANDRRLSPTGHTSLPAGTKRLQVSYTTLAVASSDRIRFRYKLEGFDADWVNAGTRRTAFYTNLSPRDYRFRVEAQSEEGTWDTSEAAWDFTIEPAIYQTNGFYALCLTAAIAGVWLVWRFRLRLVRHQFSLVLTERARLSREIHDTLLQSLVGVALQFDGISQTLDASSVEARQQLIRIRRQVEAYIREARQSIWDLRSPILETQDLATALREFAKNAIADARIRFTSTISGSHMLRCPKTENQLLRIGQEAITNAVRHAQAHHIHLEIAFTQPVVTLRVSDDGRGFDAEHWIADGSRHYGLMTMRERAEELGGTLTITTSVGRGTAIEAVVPASTHTRDLAAAV